MLVKSLAAVWSELAAVRSRYAIASAPLSSDGREPQHDAEPISQPVSDDFLNQQLQANRYINNSRGFNEFWALPFWE